MKKPATTERRFLKNAAAHVTIEYRGEGDAKEPAAFTGKAIVCNSRSKNLGGFVEIIDPKALDNADLSDVVGLFNHDRNCVLGRTTSGTMTLTRDADGGLSYRISYDATDPDHQRVMAKILRGDVVGSSFAFRVGPDGDSWDKEETDTSSIYVRTVTKISKVADVCPVTDPAYAQSSAAKRSLEEFRMKDMQAGDKGGKKAKVSAADKATRTFLEAMIPHHEMALTMAKTALEKVENEDIRAFAQDIIDDQGAEIDQMKQWLADLDAKRTAPELAPIPLSIQRRRLELLALSN